jgi:hypothetical protein
MSQNNVSVELKLFCYNNSFFVGEMYSIMNSLEERIKELKYETIQMIILKIVTAG